MTTLELNTRMSLHLWVVTVTYLVNFQEWPCFSLVKVTTLPFSVREAVLCYLCPGVSGLWSVQFRSPTTCLSRCHTNEGFFVSLNYCLLSAFGSYQNCEGTISSKQLKNQWLPFSQPIKICQGSLHPSHWLTELLLSFFYISCSI